jgi:hypothetical protein
MRVIDAFVRSWVALALNPFRIMISKPLMCATIWIKHLGIAIFASSKGCKSYDQAWRLVYVDIKKEPTINGLTILQKAFDDRFRNSNCISFFDIYCKL